MNKHKIVAGVDIGGTNTAIGVLDINSNKIIIEKSFETKHEEGANSFIEHLADVIKTECLEMKDKYLLSGIGIAAPSANYLNGTIESSANLEWGKVDILKMMKRYFDIPISILNDGNAAAIGEHVQGAAKGMKNFLVLTLGTGLGSGIMVNGQLVYGESGHAGELGHMIIKPNGRKCKCGKYGCLETYISASGLKRTALSMLSYYDGHSELRKISYDNLTSSKISELAQCGDSIAIKTFDFTGKVLGRTLANTVTYFSPEAIILFGGLAGSGDLLLKPTNYYFEKYLLNVYKGKVKILRSQLQNGRAAILGACNFLLNEMNKEDS